MGRAIKSVPWWLAEPLSILELGDAFEVVAFGESGFDPAAVVARMADLNATAAHVFPMGLHLDGAHLFFKHTSADDPPPQFDYLAGWLAHAKPAGLRTVVYFNVHSARGQYARMCPQWQQRRFDGSPKDDVYTIDSTFCVNSPWRDWVHARIRDLLAYDIDGIFFDGPVVFADCCYCDSCKAFYRERYGVELPDKKDVGHPDFVRLIEFQSDSIARFMADARSVIRAVKAHVLFYMNSNPLGPGRASGRDNRKLAPHQDILASEGGFLYGDGSSGPPASPPARARGWQPTSPT